MLLCILPCPFVTVPSPVHKTMVISLSSCPPTSSFRGIKLWRTNSSILLGSNHKSKPHFSKPLSASAKPRLSFLQPKELYLKKSSICFGRKSRNYRCRFSFSGFDLGGFESVIEAGGVLTAIIIVHESGHFLAAYLQGIHVSKFAVGFGPILAKFNANNVEYSIRAFPLGGFVGFPDNDPDSEIPADDENLLKNRPIFDRILVVSAGVIANIIFAFLIIFVQVVSVGLPVQEAFPGVLVPDVRPLSAASRGGLLPGDVILSVNGVELSKRGPGLKPAVSEVVNVIKRSPGRNVLLRIQRGGGEQGSFELKVIPDQNSDGTGKIGVQLSPNISIRKVKPDNIVQALNFTGKEFWGLSSNVLDSLKQTFLNFSQSAEKVSGPAAIIAVGAEVARSTIDGLYQFAAVLNINLAVINLLPLPALDGGTLALILIEAARGGKKLPLEVEQQIMSSGITFVLFLGIYLIIRDTLNLDFIKDIL